ncbi:MAG: hypothetical protein QNJ42_24155 [Crocosphaera sp.]|nr:hypothetical protein [Crocosphaera sp.]
MKIIVKNSAIAISSAYLLFLGVQLLFPEKDPLAIKLDKDFQRIEQNMERIEKSLDRIN